MFYPLCNLVGLHRSQLIKCTKRYCSIFYPSLVSSQELTRHAHSKTDFNKQFLHVRIVFNTIFLNHFRRLHDRKRTISLPHSVQRRSFSTEPSWLRIFPASVRPYLLLTRVDKPVGTLLLFWPCIWGASLAAPIGQLPDLKLCGMFAVGALIMRSAGCTINDLWDRDFDRHVQRTRLRPLASGAVSVHKALLFLGVQLLAGLAVLLTLNQYTIVLGFAAMPLVIVYPLMKRISNYPQLILGLTFNWGTLVGWSAVTGSLSLPHIFPLYMSGVCWTLIYDTIYGYQDKSDDMKLGLKSTAITFGDRPQLILSGLSGSMLLGLITTGLINDLGCMYFVGVGGVWLQLLWQIWTADLASPSNLWTRFSSNSFVGAAIAIAILIGHI